MSQLRDLIRDIPDFPEKGVIFKDITPVLGDSEALGALIDQMAEPFIGQGITKVAGIEARGFTLATPVAHKIGAGFVPLRKPGKLPYETVKEEYELEYGIDSLEVHTDAVSTGEKVLLVDDVIATGGTARAAVQLLGHMGADVVAFSVFIELAFLGGVERIDGVPLHALLRYE